MRRYKKKIKFTVVLDARDPSVIQFVRDQKERIEKELLLTILRILGDEQIEAHGEMFI